MYIIVAGGGKVGANVTRSLLEMGHELTLIEQRPDRFARLEEEFGPVVMRGDATEISVLERAGIARPPELLFAVTGDDEDNLVISQIAKEGYGVGKAIARVNDPRNQAHFDLLGIRQTVCATTSILGLVEHEVPEHGLVRLLQLQEEGLEIVEVQIESNSPVAGSRVGGLKLPEGSRLISVFRHGRTELVEPGTVMRPGDQVLAVVSDESGPALRKALLGGASRARLPRPVQTPVMARQQDHDRDDLQAAKPHEDDHRDLGHVAERRERRKWPGRCRIRGRRYPVHSRRRPSSRARRGGTSPIAESMAITPARRRPTSRRTG